MRLFACGAQTVYQIAASGPAVSRRFLWEHRNGLREAVDAQATLSLLDALAQYVEAISGQHDERLDMLLAYTGLNGTDPINGTEAARALGVSHQRFYQIVQQLYRARDRACPSVGIWMLPQLDAADQNGWSGGDPAWLAYWPDEHATSQVRVNFR